MALATVNIDKIIKVTSASSYVYCILPETPLRPEARGICHICHMVDH